MLLDSHFVQSKLQGRGFLCQFCRGCSFPRECFLSLVLVMAFVWSTRLSGGPKKVNHAAALVGKNIYSFGGYCTQETMHEGPIDVYMLCTETNRWKTLKTPKDPEELACVPFQRFGHSAVAYGTNIYIWGGKSKSFACNRLFCFDTVQQKWSCPQVKGSIPSARDGHTACIIDNKMYVLGGFADEFNQFADGLHALDLPTMTWQFVKTEGESPTYRDFHAACALNGKMYVFGGRSGIGEPYFTKYENYDNTMYIYDTKTRFWEKKTGGVAPMGRRSLGMVPFGKRIYIFGGYNGVKETYFNDLHYYDTELDEWSPKIKTYGVGPCERRRHCTILVNNRIFIFGGTRYYSELEDLYVGMNYFDDKCWINFDDLYVLDLEPTLCTLSMIAVIRYKLDKTCLPVTLQREIKYKTAHNKLKKRAIMAHA